MTDTLTQLYLGQPGTSAGNLFQAGTSSGNVAVVRQIMFSNTTDSNAWVSISVGSTGIDTAATRVFDKLEIPAVSSVSHGVVSWSGMIVVPQSNYMTGKQGTASAITVQISGIQVT